jgi:hypothetical protein
VGTPDGSLQLASGAPSATTRAASAVTGSAASLNGTVDPNDLETSYRFEYGTGTSYGTSVPVPAAPAGAGKLPEEVARAITGLQPDTTYHYRLVASNGAGSRDGADSSFTTAPPTVTGIQPSSGPTIGGTSVTISGTNLAGATAVRFGSSEAKSFKVQSSSTIAAVSPPGTGVVDVSVTTGAGTSGTGAADQYLYTLGPKLTPSDETGKGFFGARVALSADGNTALIGAWRDDPGSAQCTCGYGAVWVFTRSGSTWTQRGAKLTPSDESGRADFGFSVALSSNGNTALIGAPEDNSRGAAWVFTRTGSTWTQRGAKLTPSDQTDTGAFGWSVALSSNGNTALIGDLGDNSGRGAAWLFKRSGGAWTQQGAKLTASDESGAGDFGSSVALSSNGSTALIGALRDNNGHGAAWVFKRSGGAWTQQGAKLTPSDESGAGDFGFSVALSSDGDTALIGAPDDNNPNGGAWVFARSSSPWAQQGGKLTEPKSALFGLSTALSANGETALIGGLGNFGNGAASVFTRSSSTWAQQGGQLAPSHESIEGAFGLSAALSADGNIALIGGPLDRGAQAGKIRATWPWGGYGAAWVFTRSGSTWSQ